MGDLDLGPVLPGPAALSELLHQAFYVQGPREAGMRKPTCPPPSGEWGHSTPTAYLGPVLVRNLQPPPVLGRSLLSRHQPYALGCS